MVTVQIEVGINDLSCVIPLVRTLIAPVLNTAFEHQKVHGTINLAEVSASKSGL